MTTRRQQDFRIVLDRQLATRMTCEEADCLQRMNGWATVLDVSQAEHARMATWIKDHSGRQYFEMRSEAMPEWVSAHAERLGMNSFALAGLMSRTPTGMTVFIFPPWQECFRPHMDREVIFSHRRGERQRIHANPRDFNEDMNETTFRLQEARKRG